MTATLRSQKSLYADTSVFCNVLRALPGGALIAVLDYLDTSIQIVTDVKRELDGLCLGPFPDLSILKTVEMRNEYLRAPAVSLDTDIARDVELIAEHSGKFTPDHDRPRKNWGEVATVLMAARAGSPVLMDDREGRQFAHHRGIAHFTTRDLMVEMSKETALTADDAHAVWKVAESRDCSRADFDAALAEMD